MNYVEPIRDIDKIEDIHSDLLFHSQRDALMFSFGIYTGFRISDILRFKVKDVMGNSYNMREKKTNKQRVYEFNKYLKREIDEYIKGKNENEFLFKSRKGVNRPITRQRAYQIIVEACHRNGVYNVGSHTLRKTFGYFLYQKTKDVAMLMQIFNHASPDITLRYIGINQEISNKTIGKLNFSGH